MANILFISPYYPPEGGAASACVNETAVRLLKRGHKVTVLTTMPNYPTGVIFPEYRGRLFQEEFSAPNYIIGRVFGMVSFICFSSSPIRGEGGWASRYDNRPITSAFRCHCCAPTCMVEALPLYLYGF